MVFDLVQLEFHLMPVDCLDREVRRIGQQIIIIGVRVNYDMESWSHFRRDYHTERCDHGMNVTGILPAGLENDVFANDEPIKMLQSKIAFDMKNDVLANTDSSVTGSHMNESIQRRVGSICSSFGVR